MKTAKPRTKAEALSQRIVGGSLSQMATYSDLFENTTDAIFLIDLDTHQVLESNPSVERILGIAPGLIQGKDLLGWVEDSSREALKATLSGLEDAGNRPRAPFDIIFISERGSRLTLEISACRLKIADYCEVIQLIAKDVTDARNSARQLVLANERLALLSNTDEMTGLHNFRHLKSELKKEHERASRYKGSYSVILCDIDHFKNYNDRNGHLEGDEALKKVASALKERARATDLVARYGGEEFVILCANTNAEEAQVFAEALRKNIESTHFAHGDRQPLGKLTISVGVASFPEHGQSADEILRCSDHALYHSKEHGRNQVSRYDKNMKPSGKKSA